MVTKIISLIVIGAILFSQLSSVESNQDYFNILAIDGGGIRGLIPATIIEILEREAYQYIV